jgi:hypothetical protein
MHNGNTPPTNPLATQQSQLLNGYSLNGAQSNTGNNSIQRV